ncbi:hypothetical protein Gotri_007707 [Gossypium trilobum]|uniref:Uncharacterized protein n=1 Tax=Gossypium trilobum TaxID=34281 RepID=A0A7J9EHI3_9ROSI|nr:hypothetical protein [Gossypium trilobum]
MDRHMAINVGKAIRDVVAIEMKAKLFAPSSMKDYQISSTYVDLLDILLRNETRKMNISIRVTLAFSIETSLESR